MAEPTHPEADELGQLQQAGVLWGTEYSAGDVYTISGGSTALQRHLLLGAAAISLTLDCVYHAFFSCIMWVPLNVAELGLVRDKLYYQHVPCWTHLADMLHLAATSWVAVIIGWRVELTHCLHALQC